MCMMHLKSYLWACFGCLVVVWVFLPWGCFGGEGTTGLGWCFVGFMKNLLSKNFHCNTFRLRKGQKPKILSKISCLDIRSLPGWILIWVRKARPSARDKQIKWENPNLGPCLYFRQKEKALEILAFQPASCCLPPYMLSEWFQVWLKYCTLSESLYRAASHMLGTR